MQAQKREEYVQTASVIDTSGVRMERGTRAEMPNIFRGIWGRMCTISSMWMALLRALYHSERRSTVNTQNTTGGIFRKTRICEGHISLICKMKFPSWRFGSVDWWVAKVDGSGGDRTRGMLEEIGFWVWLIQSAWRVICGSPPESVFIYYPP